MACRRRNCTTRFGCGEALEDAQRRPAAAARQPPKVKCPLPELDGVSCMQQAVHALSMASLFPQNMSAYAVGAGLGGAGLGVNGGSVIMAGMRCSACKLLMLGFGGGQRRQAHTSCGKAVVQATLSLESRHA
jgi:hypothetical protein